MSTRSIYLACGIRQVSILYELLCSRKYHLKLHCLTLKSICSIVLSSFWNLLRDLRFTLMLTSLQHCYVRGHGVLSKILLSSAFATGTRSEDVFNHRKTEERPIVLQKPLHLQECNSWNWVQVLLQAINNKWPVVLPNFVALDFSGIDVLSLRQ